jgi:hypothetical protein
MTEKNAEVREMAETTLLREMALALLMLLRKERKANLGNLLAIEEIQAAINALTKAYDDFIGATKE